MAHKHRAAERIDTEFGTFYICSCGQRFTSWKRKLSNLWIAQRFFQGRGATYTGQIQGIYNTIQTGGILYLVLGGKTGQTIAIWIFILAWLTQTIFETWVGHKDYRKWKIAQNESIFPIQYSPTGKEQLSRLRNIEKILCEARGVAYDKNSVLDENE